MSLFLKLTFSCFLAFLLLGCRGDSPQGEVDLPESTKRQGVIPEHQLQALEKAKGVEGILHKAGETRRESMENNNR